MPLTSAQVAKVKYYLGYSVQNDGSDDAKNRLNSAIAAVGLDAEMTALITNPLNSTPPGVLARLDDIEAKLLASHSRLKASKVGSIELNASEVEMLRGEGRRAAVALASLIGVEIWADVFGDATAGQSRSYVWSGT